MPARDGETERENFRPRGNERWFGRRGHAVAPLATPSTTRRAQWLDPYSGSPQHGPKKSRKRWSKATTTRKDARWEEEEKENSGDRVATLGRVTYKR